MQSNEQFLKTLRKNKNTDKNTTALAV